MAPVSSKLVKVFVFQTKDASVITIRSSLSAGEIHVHYSQQLPLTTPLPPYIGHFPLSPSWLLGRVSTVSLCCTAQTQEVGTPQNHHFDLTTIQKQVSSLPKFKFKSTFNNMGLGSNLLIHKGSLGQRLLLCRSSHDNDMPL